MELLVLGAGNGVFNIVAAIVILHFIAAFGYLMYKLSPKKEDKPQEEVAENQSEE